MSSFDIKHKNEVFNLMEEFPLVTFKEIKSLAKLLEIQGIQNEENILTEKDYSLLRNKLLIEFQKNSDNYLDCINIEEVYSVGEEIKEFSSTVSKKEKLTVKISLRQLQIKFSLKELFIFQAIKILGIKDVNGGEIDYGMNTSRIYINNDDGKKVVKKVNELNTNNANKNNPLLNSKKAEQVNKMKSLTIVKKVSETKPVDVFEELIKKDTLVFIDTSSLMNDSMPDIINNNIIPILKKYSKTVFILDSVIHEISQKIQHENVTNQRRALSAKSILSKLIQSDLYQIPENYSVNKFFADAELITIFSDLRLKYNLCLITNDNSKCKGGGLSSCIMDLQTSTCIDNKNIKDITVLYIKNNQLIKYKKDRDIKFDLHKKAPKRVVL